MRKALHLKDDIDRVYVSKEGGRALVNFQDCLDASGQKLEDYVKKYKERIMTRNSYSIWQYK